jgi:hypothetical protein
MAKLFIPDRVDSDLPVFYNVEAVVGAAPATNQHEDVLLVQFLLRLMKKEAKKPESRTLFATMPLTGVVNQQTIAGIVKIQESVKKSIPTTIVDGRASPAKGYLYGPSYYTIAIMNEFVQRDYYDLWPRLDKMPEAPVRIIDLVFRTLVGGRRGPATPIS